MIASRVALVVSCLLVVVGGVETPAAALARHSSVAPVRFFFYNPTRTIECRFGFGAVACAGFGRSKLVILNPRTAPQIETVRRGFGARNPACRTPPGDDPPCWFEQGGGGPVLRVGQAVVDPDPRIYRCSSAANAITCRSLISRRGFRISDRSIATLAATR